MAKALLQSLVGYWEGACRTWLEPGKLADDSKFLLFLTNGYLL